MNLIKPKALKKGDLLGVIACSTPISNCSDETRERGYQRLRDLGFKLLEAENCRQTLGHAAGSLSARVAALHEMVANPEVKGIISFWGGFQSHQLLEYLDFDLLKKNPKPLIGYSDSTALQVGIYSKTGLVTFSGPSVITFAKPVLPEFTLKNFRSVLMEPMASLKVTPSNEYSENVWYLEPDQRMIFQPNQSAKCFRPGETSGVVIGGNVGTMLLLAGTEFWPDMTGKILFFEDDEAENTRTIDRMFTQLRQMGVFRQIAGLVVGRFPRSVGFKESDSLEMILNETLRGTSFPVFTGADFGHTDPLMTLPLGVKCRINARECSVEFLETGVI